MNKVLQIDSSIFGANGESARLTNMLVKGLQQAYPQAERVHRDLSTAPVPHFDASTIENIGKGTAEQADTLIEELKTADTLVIGAPMYNFSVPTQLKAWFDHITRAGVSFKYTPDGPVGLLGKKKVYVVTTSGGHHSNTARDAVEPWLRTILNFIGLDQNLEFIRVEGLSRSDSKAEAQAQADQQVQNIISSLIEEGDAA